MNKKMYDDFNNLYSLQKTLRFELIPQGKTQENIIQSGILDEDIHRAESYTKVKQIIDEYHKRFISEVLSTLHLSGIEEYYDIFKILNRSDDEKKELVKVEADLRKQISKAFTDSPDYKTLDSKELICKLLPEFVDGDKEKCVLLEEFKKFTTYFKGFNKNRENMYSDEDKSTAIGYRLINQNLPKFCQNCEQYHKIMKSKISEQLTEMEKECGEYIGNSNLNDLFSIDFFNNTLSQEDIDKYNYAIGIVNQHINLFNQKSEKKDRIGKLQTLYKQILSDRVKSFIPEKFSSDHELIIAVKRFLENTQPLVAGLQKMLCNISAYNLSGVFIKNDISKTNISQKVFGNWNAIDAALEKEYNELHPTKKETEAYVNKRKRSIKAKDSFDLAKLIDLIDDGETLVTYFSSNNELFDLIFSSEQDVLSYFKKEYPDDKKLQNDEVSVAVIKKYLDSIMDLVHFTKPLLGKGNESERDELFYSEFVKLWDELSECNILYNKVRNYVTQKPYSTEKIKINFRNAQLLGGWDVNKEKDCLAVLFEKNGCYYLGIINKDYKKIFDDVPEYDGTDSFKKMNYKLLPGPNKMLPKVFYAKSNNDFYAPPEYILDGYNKGKHKKGPNFDKKFCHEQIDYFKYCISIHPDWKNFGFDFSETETYEDISAFYREVQNQGYSIDFTSIPCKYINELVEDGKLFLFMIYNKDFSPYSKGTPNLHTLYWKMLFEEENLSDVVYKLNGEAEIFYRKASIPESDKVVHKANQTIKNKNEINEKTESVFDYDIVKDFRYTVDKFQFHVPITLNFKAMGNENINLKMRKAIKNNDAPYVIGIDRGERNLLYLVVIDSCGKIVEQFSLNEIVARNRNISYKTDYHTLLDRRERERNEARKDWKNIESIKELKEGYLSQVIHIISELVIKYDAIVVLEDLNMGFMRGRQKVEKQVYQKFERMLIDKLNYLVDKKQEPKSKGGLLEAYQLTEEFDSFKKLGKQSGALFYIPAWNTSKMDPTTGFVNLFNVKYENVDKAIEFWGKFNSIKYNDVEKLFEFDFDYSKFTYKAEGSKGQWILCSYGNRIRTYRNPLKNNEWDNENVCLTDELKALFKKYDIQYENEDIIPNIVKVKEKAFQEELMKTFKLILQMRNSVAGTDIDYIISPIRNKSGNFYNSEKHVEGLPNDADANGAYNIARKGLWIIKQIKDTPDEDLGKVKLAISNRDWLAFAQENL